MRRLTLHIGTEKTGTTTLQRFLVLNRARLAAEGILLPRYLGSPSHRLLPAIANDDDYVDEFFQAEGLGRDRTARRAAKDRWWQGFVEEVETARLARVLVSSEHLHSRLQTDREVARLRALLDSLFDRIDVVLYVRDPLLAAVSLFSTAIKAGVVHDRVPGPDNPYFNNIANHRATIERWSAVFGAEALRVRVFDRRRFEGGDLITDFAAAADLPLADHQRPDAENETLDHLGLELLRAVNRVLPRFDADGRPNPHRTDLQRLFETHFSHGRRYVPPPDLAEAYDTAFAASNEWVRARFFPEQDRLFPERPPAPPSGPLLPAEDLERLTTVFVELWLRAVEGGPKQGTPKQGASKEGEPSKAGARAPTLQQPLQQAPQPPAQPPRPPAGSDVSEADVSDPGVSGAGGTPVRQTPS